MPFVAATSRLYSKKQNANDWIEVAEKTTYIPWLFLTIGITLGAAWSYEVLGWEDAGLGIQLRMSHLYHGFWQQHFFIQQKYKVSKYIIKLELHIGWLDVFIYNIWHFCDEIRCLDFCSCIF